MELQAYGMLSQEADASRDATLGDVHASYLATVHEESTYDDLSGAGDEVPSEESLVLPTTTTKFRIGTIVQHWNRREASLWILMNTTTPTLIT